jgi:hypothetical protein
MFAEAPPKMLSNIANIGANPPKPPNPGKIPPEYDPRRKSGRRPAWPNGRSAISFQGRKEL